MEFENNYVKCRVSTLDCDRIQISGVIINRNLYKNILLIASNPIDKRSSYHGTGLPFPCADIAFEGSANKYEVGMSGNFNVTFSYPNSYYSVADKHKILSSIFFIIEKQDNAKEFVRFELKDNYPLRSLVNREERNGPEFYSTKYDMLPIDTSEAIMKEYAKMKSEKKIA